jgi:hypothetical protein
MHTKDEQQADAFAQIAQQRVDSRSRELIEPQPPARPKRVLPSRHSLLAHGFEAPE